MWLFEDYGLSNAFRVTHVIVAIMWMGLLWFFNFVQVPAFAEMDPGARNNALDKLTWRALWWFRWAAAATVLMGLLIIGAYTDAYFPDGDTWFFWSSAAGITLLIGITFGLIMAANVWMIIWPKQQIVIANARQVQAGGEANPDAPAAGREALMASRQNTIFSLPLLVFMLGPAHVYGDSRNFESNPSGTTALLYLVIGLVIAAVLQLNAMGKLSGRGSGGLNVIYETHKNALYAGLGLIAFFYILAEVMFST